MQVNWKDCAERQTHRLPQRRVRLPGSFSVPACRTVHACESPATSSSVTASQITELDSQGRTADLPLSSRIADIEAQQGEAASRPEEPKTLINTTTSNYHTS
jgi:hypothetical protein